MPYANEAQLVYLPGLDTIPDVTARLWMLWTTFDNSNRLTTHQGEYEDDVVRSGARFRFSFVHGPSLFEEIRRSIGLTLHESRPAMEGPLFRSGRFDPLPAPFPEDPEGYVDIVVGSPVVIDVGLPLAGFSPLLRSLPWSGSGWTVTSATLAATPGAVNVTASGTTSAGLPFTYTSPSPATSGSAASAGRASRPADSAGSASSSRRRRQAYGPER
jgi:hypothetical protein